MHSVFKNGFIQRKSFLCFVLFFFFCFPSFSCGWNVAARQGYFFFCPSLRPWFCRSLGGVHITGSGEWGEPRKFLPPSCAPEFTADFDAWERKRSFLVQDWCVGFLDCTVHLLKPYLAYYITGWSPYQCNLSRAQRTMVTSRYCS